LVRCLKTIHAMLEKCLVTRQFEGIGQ
jgi:hypothetical protein